MTPARARVLIVEDEAIVAMDLQSRVERLGHEVVGTAASGELAIQRAETLRPDLILMDIHLQGALDGVTAAEHIRRAADTPIVFLTAFSDTVTVGRATATEPFGYVLKPVDDRELAIVIGVALYRHQAEQRARRMERWLATTLSSIGDAVITTDLAGHVTFMNTVAEQLIGGSIESSRGRPIGDVMTLARDEGQGTVENPVVRLLSEGTIVGLPPGTSLIQTGGGRVPVEDSVAPIREGDGGPIIGAVLVFRDVTERQRMAAALRHSQKLEAVGHLAGGIAHEFNNLMTVVLGGCEFVLEDPRLPDDLRASVTDIQAAGVRAASLTKQLLTFGQMHLSRPRPINLNSVIADITSRLAAVLGADLTLQPRLLATDAVIMADAAEIEQMLMTFAANGRDAMAAPGTLTIATWSEPALVCLEVADTGAGMARAVLDRVFEPFFSTKQIGAGTGMSLAAVHGIVARANGHIEVSSMPGVGTTFRVRLPTLDAAPS